MKRVSGGAPVPPGYYLSLERWQLCGTDGEPLAPGEYVRVPALVAIAFAASIGVAFALFLPFMGFVTTGQFIARKLRRERSAQTLPAPHP